MPEKYKSPKEKFYEDYSSGVEKLNEINPSLSLLTDELGLETMDQL